MVDDAYLGGIMEFTKMQGCGNDYVYVNGFENKIDNPNKLSEIVSDRHFGIGSDGLIVINPSEKADFKMSMYNADGSEGKMCGNGIRCVAKYVYDNKMTDKTTITVETLSGIKTLELNVKNDKVETVKGTKIIPVEIQIRTLGMNFWAIIEHSLQYKYNGNIPRHVRERLTSAADAIYTLDNEMMSIHDEIIDAQNYVSTKANIVSDILNNIQSLYKVANKQEIIRIQDEFYEIYQTDDVARLQRFSRQVDMIAENYKAQSI